MVKKVSKILFRILPHGIIFGAMNFFIKRKYDVRIGKGARVYPNSFFEGHNAVLSGTTVQKSRIGLCTYVAHDSQIVSAKIGRYSAIGNNVKIFLGRHPAKEFVSIHPAFYSPEEIINITFCREERFQGHLFIDPDKKYVAEIGNDVWIGDNALIMDGLKIGDGAIVGAGAVVTKDVPPYAIVGGVPAKLIRYRFTEKQIKFLSEFKWWDKDIDWVKENYVIFSDIEEFINKFGNEK